MFEMFASLQGRILTAFHCSRSWGHQECWDEGDSQELLRRSWKISKVDPGTLQLLHPLHEEERASGYPPTCRFSAEIFSLSHDIRAEAALGCEFPLYAGRFGTREVRQLTGAVPLKKLLWRKDAEDMSHSHRDPCISTHFLQQEYPLLQSAIQ